jgi:hypothetical protein
MLNAGEILSVNTATNNGLNIWHIIYEMDASSPIYGGRVLGLANGDNTLFTISAGKTGTLLSGALSLFVLSSYSIINNSGGARSISNKSQHASDKCKRRG